MSVGQEQSDGVRTDAGWKRPVSAGGRHTPGQRLEGRLGAVLGAWLARTEGGRGGGQGGGLRPLRHWVARAANGRPGAVSQVTGRGLTSRHLVRSALTLTPASLAPAASTPCPASTARPVPEATRAHGCPVWASTTPGPASRSSSVECVDETARPGRDRGFWVGRGAL